MAAVEEVTAQAEAEPTSSSTVPAGYTISYFVAPKRKYEIDGVEVPSVTTVLGVIDKSAALSWWAQGMAAEGVIELVNRGLLVLGSD